MINVFNYFDLYLSRVIDVAQTALGTFCNFTPLTYHFLTTFAIYYSLKCLHTFILCINDNAFAI